MNRKRFALFALLSLFFLAGCGVRQADIASPSGKTPVPEATGGGSSAAIEGSTPPAEAVLASTPTPAAVPATGTSPVPPTDLCREYLPLSVLQGEAKAEAVATSYRCHGASIDSTGRSPSTSPDWVVQRGTPIHLQLAVEQRPTAIEVRLYPGAGISASFLRWPEEFPIRIEAADMSQPEPGTRFRYLPQAPEGPYSLVVHIAWEEEVEVFYALSFTLEDAAPTRAAAARATPKPTATPTRAVVARATPKPTATPTPASLALLPGQAPDEVKLDVVQQIGGHSLAVAVEQGRVYLGIGPRLVVLDALTPLAESPSLGQSEVLPGIVQDVALVNNLAYVAAGKAGLILLDSTDPSNTRALGIASTPGDAQSVVVEPEDGLAYVAGGSQGGPDQGGMLSIVDVSEPEMPEEVTSVEVPGFAYDVALVEQYAYVVHEDGLMVIDVHDPADPTAVVNVRLPQPARAIAVAGGYAYVAGDGLHVMDLSDPAEPRQVGHLQTTFLPPEAVAVWGELAALSETFCEMGHCGSTVRLVDVSDPANPHEVGTWMAKSAVEDVFVHENTLYLASWQKGLQMVDVSDPASPYLLGQVATLPSVEDVAVSGGLAYVSDGAESGLLVLDLTVLSEPRVRGRAESARWAGGYAIVDGYAHVPMWDGGFRILDVRDPDGPREVAAVDLGMAGRAVVVGERTYVTIGYDGLIVLDVADPSAPRMLGGLSLDGLAEGLAVAGDRAYVTVEGSKQNLLYVIDVSDPAQPSERGKVALQGRGGNIALDPDASYAYVAIADCMYHQCSGGLQVVDVRDPSRPRTVVTIEMPGGAFDVAVAGGYAFVAAGEGGVWVLDVSDPESPRAAGWRDTAGSARSIVAIDGLVYIADGSGGLLVLVPVARIAAEFWSGTGTDPDTPVAMLLRPEASSSRFGDIAAMHVDGTHLVRLTTYPYNTDPVLAPDRQRIAYRSVPRSIASLADPKPRLEEGYYNIWVIAVDGAQAWQLTDSERQRGIPTWSPDSRKVAFVEGPEGLLVEIEVETRTRRQLVSGVRAPRYRPDNAGIGYLASGGGLAWIDAQQNVHAVVPTEALSPNTSVVDFDWLPDGGHILYTLADETDRIDDLPLGIKYSTWIARSDGSDPRKLADGIHDVRVSPDGQAIAALQGSGWSDACLVDQQLVFLRLAPDLTAVETIGIEGFEGYPRTGPDQSFYPHSESGRIRSSHVAWVSGRLAFGPFSITCTLDRSAAGRYAIDVVNGRMAKVVPSDATVP